MAAFAANSLLCRAALGEGLVDAATFTTVRVASGAAMLGLILSLRGRVTALGKADWRNTAMLFTYMACFSFAYLSLGAGTGALILFGAVQMTMFGAALAKGEPFSPLSWAGLGMAGLGLAYLVFPGVTAPDPLGAVLMAVAGAAWGGYSLLGRRAAEPLSSTANAFLFCVPPVLLVSLAFRSESSGSVAGIALAIASGAIASGCGYVVWYAALRGLSAARAATVQLSVPAIAGFGGVALLGEAPTLRLVLASAAILGGVAIVLSRRSAAPRGKRAARASEKA
jgi:drug/metabolite transporter (DMT)-like permease